MKNHHLGTARRQRIALLILGAVATAVLIAVVMANFDPIRRWQKKHFGPVPFIETVVEAVKADGTIVVLSVGLDQKLREGFEFMIFRGKKIVGRVQIFRVFEDLAGARILFTAPNEAILVGDEAARWR